MQREAECQGPQPARIPQGHHHGMKASDSSQERLYSTRLTASHSLRTNIRGPGHTETDTHPHGRTSQRVIITAGRHQIHRKNGSSCKHES